MNDTRKSDVLNSRRASVNGYPPIWDKMSAAGATAFLLVLMCGPQDGWKSIAGPPLAGIYVALMARIWVKADNEPSSAKPEQKL